MKNYIVLAVLVTLVGAFGIASAEQIVQSGLITVNMDDADNYIATPEETGSFTDGNILVNPGFETGSLSPWYTTSGMWSVVTTSPHAGSYCAYDIGNYWIRQDFTGIPVADINAITLWSRQPEQCIQAVDLMYSDGSYYENIIWPLSTWAQYDVTSWLTPGKTLTGLRIWGYVGGPPQPDETFIDDIVVDKKASNPNVTIDVNVLTPVVQKPGTLKVKLTVTNNESTPVTCEVFTRVKLPNGSWYPTTGWLFGPQTVTVPANSSKSGTLSHKVPASAPLGNYTYEANVGQLPTIWSTDTGAFTIQ
jgi:hypothetical protein